MISLRNYIKNLTRLSFSSFLALAIGMMAAPILSRIYSPSQFGFYAIFLTAVTVISAFTTGGYEFIILSEEKDTNAWAGVLLVGIFSLCSSLLLLFIAIVTRFFLNETFSEHCTFTTILIATCCLFMSGAYNALYYWSNRQKQYNRMASNRVIASLVVVITSIGAGFLMDCTRYGLFLGTMFGLMTNVSMLFLQVMLYDDPPKERSAKLIKDLAIQHLDYPKFYLPAMILDRILSQSQVILFAIFFNSVVVGSISLVQRIINIPASTVGNAIGDIFKQTISKDLLEKRLGAETFLRTASFLTILAIGPFILMMIYGPTIFSIIFGQNWELSGRFAQIMAPLFLFGFVTSPLSSIFSLKQRQKDNLVFQALAMAIVVPSVTISYYLYEDAVVVVGVYTAVYCVKYAIQFFWSLKIAQSQ